GADLVLGLAQRRLGLLEGEAAVVHVGAHPLLQQRAAEHGQAQQGHDQQQDEDDDEGCALLAPGELDGLVHRTRFRRAMTFSTTRVSGWPSVPVRSVSRSVSVIRTARTLRQASAVVSDEAPT